MILCWFNDAFLAALCIFLKIFGVLVFFKAFLKLLRGFFKAFSEFFLCFLRFCCFLRFLSWKLFEIELYGCYKRGGKGALILRLAYFARKMLCFGRFLAFYSIYVPWFLFFTLVLPLKSWILLVFYPICACFTKKVKVAH